MKKTSPPRWADRLLEWFCAPHLLEHIQGDLHEEFAYQVEQIGQQRASWLYVWEVLGFVKPRYIKRKPSLYPSTHFYNIIMLRNHLKMAWRNLLNNKMYSFINITGLAMGMAVVLLIGLFIRDEYSFDRFNPNFNQIYRVVETQKQSDGPHPVAVTPGPLASALKNDFAEIEQTVRIGLWRGLLQYEAQNIEPENILIVDKSFFSMFDFRVVKGSTRTLFDNPDEIALTEKTAALLFGNDWFQKDILGKTIVLNSTQKQPLKLVAVVKNLPNNSHIQADVFLPFKYLDKSDELSSNWNSNNYHTYLKIRPETNIATFEKKLASYLSKYEANTETLLCLQPIKDIYLYSKFDFQTDWGKRSDVFYVYLFMTVGLIVLLIAIFNFINLATARSTQRAKEVGLRQLIGARRLTLISQFLTEAFFVVSIALLLAVVLADLMIPLLNELSHKTLFVPVNQTIFWYTLGVFLILMTLFSGLYPAVIMSAFQPAKVLKGFFAVSTGKYFRQSLVVGQFTLSIVLTISTFIVYRQLVFMQNKSLGFDKEQLVYVKLKGDLKGKAMLFKEEISTIIGIESTSVTTNNLVNVTNSSTIEWEGQRPKDEFQITQMNIDPHFLKTIGAKLIAGRNFSESMASDTSDKFGVYMINETAALRMGWPPSTAIGKKVKFWGLEGSIVGVLKDLHFRPLSVGIEPLIFRYRPKEFYFNVLIKTKPFRLKQTMEAVAKVYKKYEANYPFSYGFVNQDLDRQYANEQRIGAIFLIFSILAIFISCMGLFGLVTFTTQQRIKEIGIRKVLGASVLSITTLLSIDFLKLVLLSCIIAFPLGYWMMSLWLKGFVYRINIEWWVFALAGLLSIMISLLTISYQSVKTALLNPVKSLKTE
ncbi:MAG: permease prefix domain 2-containing transporter [Spirosomataceae bacterium]